MYKTFLSVASDDARDSTDLKLFATEREMLFKFEFIREKRSAYVYIMYIYYFSDGWNEFPVQLLAYFFPDFVLFNALLSVF